MCYYINEVITMLIDNFFTTRALANLFGMKGMERDIFFALCCSDAARKRVDGCAEKVQTQPKHLSAVKCTGESAFSRSVFMPPPIGAFSSVMEINRMMNGKQETVEETDKQRIRNASSEDFAKVLSEIAARKLSERKSD